MGDKVPLRGKVTFKEDNSPLTRGQVCFETDSYRARGTLMPDGTYQVSSVKANDGIPPGLYKVYVFGAENPIESPGGNMRAARSKSLIATKYTNANTSGITVQVDGKTKQFDFQVEKP
jgi:flagellar hook assembly protein FlgD